MEFNLPQDQYAALEAYISQDDYLQDRRGQFAERNRNRARWSHVIDLKFAQEFSVNVKETKHTFQFSADIFQLYKSS